MTFMLRLNLQEKRHALLRQKVQNNPDLEVGYLIKYTTKGGGVGQTYLFAKSDKQAQKKAKKTVVIFGTKLLSVVKSSKVLYNKSKDRYVKERV